VSHVGWGQQRGGEGRQRKLKKRRKQREREREILIHEGQTEIKNEKCGCDVAHQEGNETNNHLLPSKKNTGI